MATASQHHRLRIQSWRCSLLPFLTICAAILPAAAAHSRNFFADTTLIIPRSTQTIEAAAVTLLRDDRIPIMQHGQWTYVSQDEEIELRKRDDSTTAITTAAPTTKTATTATGTGTTKTKTTTASALPSIFDSSLASNFSTGSACPSFINAFLTNPTFKKCYPFSLLLQGSRSFFEAEKSIVSTTQVLDATCAANATYCTTYLKDLAANLTDTSNCGADYKLGNSIVVEAYLGMVAYQPLYSASCLKDPDTSSYCYADAVTNLTTPANVYFYYLPLNISFPGSSMPSCNWCLQQTMAVFRSASANRNMPIANTYLSAAQQVDTVCGPAFVNDSLPAAITSNGVSLLNQRSPQYWLMPSILLGVAIRVLLL